MVPLPHGGTHYEAYEARAEVGSHVDMHWIYQIYQIYRIYRIYQIYRIYRIKAERCGTRYGNPP